MLIDPIILRKLFPYLNFVAIGLSIVKLMIYYGAFGVNILQYLDLSESIVLCFEDIVHFFLFLSALLVASILFLHNIGDFNTENVEKAVVIESFWKRLMAYFWHNKLLVIFNIYCGWLFNPYFLLVIPLLYLLFEAKYKLKIRYHTDLNSTYHNVILWIVLFVAFDYSYLLREINATKYYGRYEGTILTIDTPKEEESHIAANSEILFVGKTKEFYYLYDTKKGNALIIPSDKVTRIELKNKYNWFWQYPK